MNFAFPAASADTSYTCRKPRHQPLPPGDVNVPTGAGPAVGGATAEEPMVARGGEGANRPARKARTCAGRKEAHLPPVRREEARSRGGPRRPEGGWAGPATRPHGAGP